MRVAAARVLPGFACALALALATAAARAAGPACSADAFTVDGAPLAVEVCAPAEPLAGSKVTLTERFTLKGLPPLERTLVVDVLPKAETSRSIDDVPLTKLGIEKILHLTIVYKPGSARLEHALLVPGAIALK